MTTQTDTAHSPMSDSHMSTLITASLVPDEQRLDFWPLHFGRIPQWIFIETRIFGWMDRFCEDYSEVSGISTYSATVARLWPPKLTLMRNGGCSTT